MAAFVTGLGAPRAAETVHTRTATCKRHAGRGLYAVAASPRPAPSPLEKPDGLSGATEISSAQQFLALQAAAAATGQTCYVLFRAQHCRACKAVAGKFVAWAGRRGLVATVRVDEQAGRELASRLGVHQVPLVQVYSGARRKTSEYTLTMTRMRQLREEDKTITSTS